MSPWRRYEKPLSPPLSFAAESRRQRGRLWAGRFLVLLQAIHLAVELDRLHGPLFTDLDLSIARSDKVALVGANGAGKSTLLRVLTGDLEPSAGHVILKRGCSVALLPQDLPDFEFDQHPALLGRFWGGHPWPPGMDGSGSRGLPPSPELRRASRPRAMLGDPSGVSAPFQPEGMSPGERMRLAIGSLLASDPDILLLDEPTNHLDLPAREWLEEFLRNCPQAVLAVTHDRSFADAVADRVLELEGGRLREYAGGYSDMLHQKSVRVEREMERYGREKAELRRLKNTAEKTLQRAGQMTRTPKNTNVIRMSKPYYAGLQKKLDKRAKAIRTRVDQLADRVIEKPFVAEDLKLEFPTAPLRSAFAVQARGLSKTYGQRVLFRDLAFDAEAGERVAVIGPNGAGKTTLIRGLLDPDSLDAGEVTWGSGARPALLSQERILGDPNATILEVLGEFDQQRVRTTLGSLGMRGDAAGKKLGVLSVGERSRVELVRILLSGANVLLLDEPTNHLDLPSLEAMEHALDRFEGTVIFISHDRRFIETFADHVVRFGMDADQPRQT